MLSILSSSISSMAENGLGRGWSGPFPSTWPHLQGHILLLQRCILPGDSPVGAPPVFGRWQLKCWGIEHSPGRVTGSWARMLVPSHSLAGHSRLLWHRGVWDKPLSHAQATSIWGRRGHPAPSASCSPSDPCRCDLRQRSGLA